MKMKNRNHPAFLIQLISSKGDIVSETQIHGSGRYCIHGFDEGQLSVKPIFFGQASGIELQIERNHFQLRYPTSLQLKLNHEDSSISTSEFGMLELKWNKTPEILSLEAPNAYQLRIQKSKLPKQLISSQMKKAVSLLMVATAHLFLFGLVAFTADFEPKEPDVKLDKVQVSVVSLPDLSRQHSGVRKSASSLTAGELRAQRLMKAWNFSDRARNQAPSKEQIKQMMKRDLESFKLKSSPIISQSDGFEFRGSPEGTTQSVALNLEPDYLAKTLKSANRDLERCFNDSLIQDRNLSGEPFLWIDFDENGRAVKVNVEGMKASKSDSVHKLESCFLSAYQKLKLKRPNQAFSVTRTLVLQKTRSEI